MTILMAFVAHDLARACIWDSDTLSDEKKHSPTLAAAIISPETMQADVKALRARIEKLRAVPNESDPAWWSDWSGAYLRLGEAAEAVKILEPLTNRFATNYAIHANLGTAYHLLGRYAEAEREIARDLEINPDAHFGLEKYHLALLEYLMRDEEYRLRHVYVDEFTSPFLTEYGLEVYFRNVAVSNENEAAVLDKDASAALSAEVRNHKTFSRNELYRLGQGLDELAWSDKAPAYRLKWNLAQETNLEKGVVYMAGLNGREPACWTMLGLLAVQRHDKHLTIAAYEKAIQLGSPQASILQAQIDVLKEHIAKAVSHRPGYFLVPVVIVCVIAIVLIMGLRAIFRSAFECIKSRKAR
jgi:tetratricopeptide (TPR) repeat protein